MQSRFPLVAGTLQVKIYRVLKLLAKSIGLHACLRNCILILTKLIIIADVMKMVKLAKQGASDQHGYVISNTVVKDTYLQVTEEKVRSKKRAVRFTAPKEIEVFYKRKMFTIIIPCKA